MKEVEMVVTVAKTLANENIVAEIYIKGSDEKVSLSEKLDIKVASNNTSSFDISNFTYSSDSDIIMKMQPIKITMMLHNKENVDVDNVTLSIALTEGVMLIDGKSSTSINHFVPNGLKVLTYSLITNSTYDDDKISLKITIKDALQIMKMDKILTIPFG